MRYFLFFLALLPFLAPAQSLQGTVTDAVTGKPLYLVTVVNTKTQESVYTDQSGLYSIRADVGDPVAFMYVGYKDVHIIKPPSVIVASQNIAMQPAANQLKEVIVRPGNLSPYQVDSLERRSIYKVALRRHPPSPFNSPVSALAEMFSHRARETYKFQKVFAAGETQKFIDTRYTPELVTELTGLTGDSIGHFMFAYPIAYDFARAASDLELKMWVRHNYREWLKAQTVAITPENGAAK